MYLHTIAAPCIPLAVKNVNSYMIQALFNLLFNNQFNNIQKNRKKKIFNFKSVDIIII